MARRSLALIFIMNTKDTNLKIVDEVIRLLKLINIEKGGHEQGYIFIFGQNDNEKVKIRGASGGCPTCVTPILITQAMKSDPDFANAVPKAMVDFVKSKFNDGNDGIKLQKGQEN